MSSLPWVFLALIAAKASCEITLLVAARRRALTLQAGPVPEEAAGAFADDAGFRKAMAYSAAKSRDAIVDELVSLLTNVALVLGVAAILHGLLSGPGGGWRQSLTLIGFFTLTGLVSLPGELRSLFGTETKFGFNKTTPGLWAADKVKGLLLGALIGLALLTPCAWFLGAFPVSWWLWAWGVFCAFQLLAAGLLTVVLLPLFNKLTPLADGPLKTRLLGLAARAGFAAGSVQVMDGSRRSAHANAFFAGFGKMRRIVLFDTLLEQLKDDELEAVLAHEIGHWKRGHILRRIALGTLGSLPVFALAGALAQRPEIAGAFGFHTAAGAAMPFSVLVILLSLALDPTLYWLSPLMNGLSRRHEFEADACAAELTGGPAPLVRALRKLYSANAGNPLPHPAYALFHHSHPTLPERERALGARVPVTAP